ncbi:MAG TPA: WG repeat-containing protein, partial [Bacteroidia bacterium]|nr:WG repeat-containing protein [Bacteroidia bacterium]
ILSFDSLFEARQGDKWGWIDKRGSVAIPFVFDSICTFGGPRQLRYVTVNGKMGVIDSSGNFILPPTYQVIHSASGDSVFNVESNFKHGLISRSGSVLVPVQYEFLYNARAAGDSIYVAGTREKHGLITQHGKQLTPMKFDCVGSHWVCGTTVYSIGLMWGHVTTSGKMSLPVYRTEVLAEAALTPCPDDTVFYDLHEGLALVAITKTGKWGYMRADRSWAIEPVYDEANHFSENCAVVMKDGVWFYIDTSGQKLFGNYADASPFHDGVAFVNSKILIDKTGKEIARSRTPIFSYEQHSHFFRVDARSDDFADGEWGLMNLRGVLIVDPHLYHDYGTPSDGMIAVCKKVDDDEEINSSHDHIWGFVDTTGREMIPCKYSDLFFMSHFSSGLAPVSENGKYGYIGKNGNTVIPFMYESAGNFHNGLARVWMNDKMKYIDPQGRVVWEEK